MYACLYIYRAIYISMTPSNRYTPCMCMICITSVSIYIQALNKSTLLYLLAFDTLPRTRKFFSLCFFPLPISIFVLFCFVLFHRSFSRRFINKIFAYKIDATFAWARETGEGEGVCEKQWPKCKIYALFMRSKSCRCEKSLNNMKWISMVGAVSQDR